MRKSGYFLKALAYTTIAVLWVGCGSFYLDEAQNELRSSFTERDYAAASELLQEYEQEEIYRQRDLVLMNLERGAVHHFSGNYERSNQYFTEAEHEIEDLFGTSLSRNVRAFVINDYALEYSGEDYEDIYLNAFKSLNYMHLGDFDAALVEARRMSFKMERLDEHYRGLAESLARQDTTDQVTWEAGETNIENSAMGHYLAAVLYSKSDRPDNARIELERTRVALDDQRAIGASPDVTDDLLQQVAEPESYNVMLKGFAGRSPHKEENDFRVFIPEEDFYIRFALPSLKTWETEVSSVQAVVNDTLDLPMKMIEEMDKVAEEVYQVREPIVYGRSFVRSFLKAFGGRELTQRVKEESETLGGIMNVLGIVGQEASERADLRAWQTLPGKAYTNLLYLPEGSHRVRIEYLDNNDRILFYEEQQLDITESNTLQVMQTIYSN